MSAPSISVPTDDEYHQAVGWLLSAIESDHPGYLAKQATLAEGIDLPHPCAATLRDWAQRFGREPLRPIESNEDWMDPHLCGECGYHPTMCEGAYPDLCHECGHQAHKEAEADRARDER